MRRCQVFILALLSCASVAAAAAQTPDDRKRARIQNQLGWDDMRTERWESAAKAFQQAIDIDRTFADAHYGLGRAQMALKRFPAAIEALAACRDLYLSQAGRQFASQQDAQRARNDRITEIDERIRQVQSMPSSMQQQDLLRQLNNQRRDIQEALTRGGSLSFDAQVPPWVSLSLGSAYFRAGLYRRRRAGIPRHDCRRQPIGRGPQQPRRSAARDRSLRGSRDRDQGRQEGWFQSEPSARTGDPEPQEGRLVNPDASKNLSGASY